jgi:hypothetical protein
MKAAVQNNSVPGRPQISIRSSNPIELKAWLEPVMNEFADQIATLSDRISDHLIDDIERSFVDTDLWREVAFLAIATRVLERLSEAVDELMRLRMSDHARQFAIGFPIAQRTASE